MKLQSQLPHDYLVHWHAGNILTRTAIKHDLIYDLAGVYVILHFNSECITFFFKSHSDSRAGKIMVVKVDLS